MVAHSPMTASPTKPHQLTRFTPSAQQADQVLADLADPAESLLSVARSHNTTAESLCLWLAHPEIAERIAAMRSAVALRTRWLAAEHLPACAQLASRIVQSALESPDLTTPESALRAARLLLRLAAFDPNARPRPAQSPNPAAHARSKFPALSGRLFSLFSPICRIRPINPIRPIRLHRPTRFAHPTRSLRGNTRTQPLRITRRIHRNNHFRPFHRFPQSPSRPAHRPPSLLQKLRPQSLPPRARPSQNRTKSTRTCQDAPQTAAKASHRRSDHIPSSEQPLHRVAAPPSPKRDRIVLSPGRGRASHPHIPTRPISSISARPLARPRRSKELARTSSSGRVI